MKYSSLVDRIANRGSEGWAVHFEASTAAQRGEDVIILSVGDPDFATPGPIVAAAVEALEAGDTHYADIEGRYELRSLIASRFAERTGVEVAAENVMVTAGTQQALFGTSLCLFETGDELLVPDPMYLTYEATLQAAGARVVPVPLKADDRFRFDVDALAASCTDSTRGLVITTPNNPTGAVASAAELEAMAALATERDLWVVSDEVYADLVFNGQHLSIAGFPGMADRTVTVSSLSKSHAMTGWRIGWAIGPAELVEHFGRLGLAMAYGLPGFVQAAAVEALTNQDSAVGEMRRIYQHRRDLVADELGRAERLPVLVPEAGMYVMCDVSSFGMSSREFAWALYEATGVSVVDAGAFGANAEGWVRISFTTGDDELGEGCRRIVRFVQSLPAA